MELLENNLSGIEEWREYDFADRIYRIINPVMLYYREGGTTHRVLEPPRLEAKRGFVVDVGIDLSKLVRHYGPPTNVLMSRNYVPLSKG